MIEDSTLEPLRARGYELGGFLGSGAFSEVGEGRGAEFCFFRSRRLLSLPGPPRSRRSSSPFPAFLFLSFFLSQFQVIAATQTLTGAQVAIKRVTGGGADAAAFAAAKRRSVRLPIDDGDPSTLRPPALAPPPAPGAREAAALRELRGHPNVIRLLEEVELVREARSCWRTRERAKGRERGRTRALESTSRSRPRDGLRTHRKNEISPTTTPRRPPPPSSSKGRASTPSRCCGTLPASQAAAEATTTTTRTARRRKAPSSSAAARSTRVWSRPSSAGSSPPSAPSRGSGSRTGT